MWIPAAVLILPLVVVGLASPRAAAAQSSSASSSFGAPAIRGGISTPAMDRSPSWKEERPAPNAAVQPGGSGRTAVATGVLVGAVAGAGVSYWAARRYGENEGGELCVRCWTQWSAVTVPAGAAIGAVVGYGVSRITRRSVSAAPMLSRRSRGIIFVAQF